MVLWVTLWTDKHSVGRAIVIEYFVSQWVHWLIKTIGLLATETGDGEPASAVRR